MSIPSWKDIGNAWDVLGLAGQTIPGVAKVTGKVSEKIDVQIVKGTKGAKTTDEGPDPAELSIEILQTREEAGVFEGMIDSIHPRKNDQHAGPMEIVHPSANLLGITQVRIKSISLPQVEDDLIRWTIDAVEYFPEPKKAKAKTPAKKTNSSSYVPNSSGYMPDYNNGSYNGSNYTSPSQEGLSNLDSVLAKYPNSPKVANDNYPF